MAERPAPGTLAEQVAAFAVANPYDALPDAVVDSVRKRVLDTVGIAIAATALPTSAAATAFAAEQGGAPQATALGHAEAMPAVWAAFVNGVLAHSLDYDDTHLPSVLHPSASVVPAALAAAEATGADGRQLVAAIACGLEICVRLGMAGYDRASGASVYFEHGQHATSICGAMGAALSVGLLSGLGADGIVHALGVAASMSSGIIEANRTGGTVKRLHCGWAAHAGVSAAQLVRHGITGPATVLEGRFGFFQAWLHGQVDHLAVTDGLGERWEVPGIFFKPYPANHFTHTAVDAARALRRRGVEPAEVVSMTLGVPGPIVHTIGEPIEVKRRPETGYMAQFSGPYAVVAGLLGGGGLAVGLDDYTDELAHDPARRHLMSLVDVVEDDRCTAVFPHQFPSILRVRLRDGTELVEAVMSNRGGSERPLTLDELTTKFTDNATRVLPVAVVQDAREMIGRLEQLDDIRALLGPLRAGTGNRQMGKEMP